MFHRWGLVLLVLALAGPALAQRRRMGKFQEPNHQELTDEEMKESRTRRRLAPFEISSGDDEPEEPFPWRAAGLAVLAFAVAAPFAYGAWKATAKELEAAQRAFFRKGGRITKKPPAPSEQPPPDAT